MSSPDLSRPFDVAISGAGLAGATLAWHLARSGARVALLDATSFPRDKLCGEFLSPECWGVLDRLGLADVVSSSDFQAIRRIRLSTPRGRVLEAEVVGSDGLPGIGLSRSFLDDRLVQHARGVGVDVFEQSRVAGPIIKSGRVVGLAARHAAQGPFEVHATVVVAADGRHSALVRHTGTTRGGSVLRPRLFGMKRHLIVSDPQAAEPPGTIGLHLVRGGYVGTCRIEQGRTNLCALLPEASVRQHRGNMDRLAEQDFLRNPVLAHLWNASRPEGEWKTIAGVRVESSSPRFPGIFYVGDGQGTVDPLGGQGMTMAMLGAELLAPFVLEALRGEGASTALQARYRASWRQRFRRRIRLCRLFHHALNHPSLIDLLSTSRTFAPRILTHCYTRTRDVAHA